MKKLRTIDLYAGVGGIRIGFERAGFSTIFANDFEKNCKITYDLNFKDVLLDTRDIGEIKPVLLPNFDFLLGGFPCQPFSIAGYRKGFEDTARGHQFFNIIKILREKKPMGFLLENVKNLSGHDGGKTFKIIEDSLKSIGYHIKSKVMSTMEYGNIPQNRERIYIVGFKNKKFTDKFEFPEPKKLQKTILDLLEDPKLIDKKYYYNDKPLFAQLKKYSFKKGVVYQWRRHYIRENKSGVCPTLTANMGTGGHNVPLVIDSNGVRKLTPRECARFQGFPDSYKLPKISDSHLYKQFGNSVSIPVIEAVAKQMIKAME